MSTIRGTGVGDLSLQFFDSSTYRLACTHTAKAKSKGKQRTLEKFGMKEIDFASHEGPYSSFEYHHYHSLPLELREIFSSSEHKSLMHTARSSARHICQRFHIQESVFTTEVADDLLEDTAFTLLEALECGPLASSLQVVHTIFYFLLGESTQGVMIDRTVQVALALGDAIELLVLLLKENFDQKDTAFWQEQDAKTVCEHRSILLSVVYILLQCHREEEEFMVSLASTGLSSYLIRFLSQSALILEQTLQQVPIRKILLVLSRSLSVSFHQLNCTTRNHYRSSRAVVTCPARQEDFHKQKEARNTFGVQIPQVFDEAEGIIRRSLHICPESYLTEDVPLSDRLEAPLTELVNVIMEHGERASQVLLQLLHSVGPHGSQETRLDTSAELSMGEQPKTASEQIRLHDIMLQAITASLLTIMQTLRTYNLYAFRLWCGALDDDNVVAVLLTSLHCDLQPFLHRDYDIPSMFGRAPEEEGQKSPYTYRNMTSLVHCLRILKKIVHHNVVRERTMVHYKAPVICKRLLAVDCPVVRYHVLKLLKPLIKHLNNRWRSKNCSILSAIALQVPQELMDDWILPLDNSEQNSTAIQSQEQVRENTRTKVQELLRLGVEY